MDNKYRIKADRANPISNGYICKKGVSAGNFFARGNRVSDFSIYGSKVTQQVFFENLALKLKDITESYGSDAIGVYFGTNAILGAAGIWSGMGFLYRINSKSFFTVCSIDNIDKVFVAHQITRGCNPSVLSIPDLNNTDFLLIIGSNPVISNGHLYSNINFKKKLSGVIARGGFVLTLDPRKTETAKNSSLHIQLPPKADPLVLLILVKEYLYRNSLDEVAARLKLSNEEIGQLKCLMESIRFLTPESVAKSLDVTAHSIQRVIDLFIASRGFSYITGTGVSFSEYSILTEWLCWFLCALKDGFGRKGGNYLVGGAPAIDKEIHATPDFAFDDAVSGKKRRAFELPCAALVDYVESGRLKALFVFGGNPITAFPGDTVSTLKKLDLLVSLHTHHNAVTEISNYVAPVCGPFERSDSTAYVQASISQTVSQYTPPVFGTYNNSIESWPFFSLLGDCLGLDVTRLGKPSDSIRSDEVLETIKKFKIKSAYPNSGEVTDAESGCGLNECSPKGRPNILDNVFIEKATGYIKEPPLIKNGHVTDGPDRFNLICGRAKNFMNSENIVDENNKNVNFLHMNTVDASTLGLFNGNQVYVSRLSHSGGRLRSK
jgi:formate dehydrogenase